MGRLGSPQSPGTWVAHFLMGTLGGFPNPPALWLRRAKPAFAYAIMGTLGGFASPFGPPPAPSSPLASVGLAKPSRALASAGKARLRLRDHGSPTSTPRDYGESLRDLQAKILATASSHSDGC